MKRHGHLMEQVCDFANLLAAFTRARRGCGWSAASAAWFFHLETEALREWRREAAREAGVPVCGFAANRQLEAVARQRPGSRAALAQISGFGKKKLARHGEAILALLAAFAAG